MSADLQVRQELVGMRLPDLIFKEDEGYEESKSEGCETPKTPRSLIPEIRNCPPAPRKPRSAVSCKRKQQEELVLFEVVAREEVEAFFTQFEVMSKRRFVVLEKKIES